jgi:hypothetical protein
VGRRPFRRVCWAEISGAIENAVEGHENHGSKRVAKRARLRGFWRTLSLAPRANSQIAKVLFSYSSKRFVDLRRYTQLPGNPARPVISAGQDRFSMIAEIGFGDCGRETCCAATLQPPRGRSASRTTARAGTSSTPGRFGSTRLRMVINSKRVR